MLRRRSMCFSTTLGRASASSSIEVRHDDFAEAEDALAHEVFVAALDLVAVQPVADANHRQPDHEEAERQGVTQGIRVGHGVGARMA
jgi:hypothetical protein